jgi:hypothetical protein
MPAIFNPTVEETRALEALIAEISRVGTLQGKAGGRTVGAASRRAVERRRPLHDGQPASGRTFACMYD